MAEYFRALHEGDVEGIRAMFLADGGLFWAQDDGQVTYISLEAYLEIVRGRTAPKAAGHRRYGLILTIDLGSARTALAKVRSAVQPRFYTDYLTLVRRGDDWKIASKVYHLDRAES